MRGLYGFLFMFLILFLMFFPASLAEEFYVVEEAALVVYRNGDVKVRIVLSVNETEPVVTLPLLTSSVSDLLIFNETGHLIPYEIEDHNLTIFSLGSTNVTVEYYTSALTSKEAELWTLNFTSPFYLTVELPENATIMYLSDIPSAITIEEGKIIFDILSRRMGNKLHYARSTPVISAAFPTIAAATFTIPINPRADTHNCGSRRMHIDPSLRNIHY